LHWDYDVDWIFSSIWLYLILIYLKNKYKSNSEIYLNINNRLIWYWNDIEKIVFEREKILNKKIDIVILLDQWWTVKYDTDFLIKKDIVVIDHHHATNNFYENIKDIDKVNKEKIEFIIDKLKKWNIIYLNYFLLTDREKFINFFDWIIDENEINKLHFCEECSATTWWIILLFSIFLYKNYFYNDENFKIILLTNYILWYITFISDAFWFNEKYINIKIIAENLIFLLTERYYYFFNILEKKIEELWNINDKFLYILNKLDLTKKEKKLIKHLKNIFKSKDLDWNNSITERIFNFNDYIIHWAFSSSNQDIFNLIFKRKTHLNNIENFKEINNNINELVLKEREFLKIYIDLCKKHLKEIEQNKEKNKIFKQIDEYFNVKNEYINNNNRKGYKNKITNWNNFLLHNLFFEFDFNFEDEKLIDYISNILKFIFSFIEDYSNFSVSIWFKLNPSINAFWRVSLWNLFIYYLLSKKTWFIKKIDLINNIRKKVQSTFLIDCNSNSWVENIYKDNWISNFYKLYWEKINNKKILIWKLNHLVKNFDNIKIWVFWYKINEKNLIYDKLDIYLFYVNNKEKNKIFSILDFEKIKWIIEEVIYKENVIFNSARWIYWILAARYLNKHNLDIALVWELWKKFLWGSWRSNINIDIKKIKWKVEFKWHSKAFWFNIKFNNKDEILELLNKFIKKENIIPEEDETHKIIINIEDIIEKDIKNLLVKIKLLELFNYSLVFTADLKKLNKYKDLFKINKNWVTLNYNDYFIFISKDNIKNFLEIALWIEKEIIFKNNINKNNIKVVLSFFKTDKEYKFLDYTPYWIDYEFYSNKNIYSFLNNNIFVDYDLSIFEQENIYKKIEFLLNNINNIKKIKFFI